MFFAPHVFFFLILAFDLPDHSNVIPAFTGSIKVYGILQCTQSKDSEIKLFHEFNFKSRIFFKLAKLLRKTIIKTIIKYTSFSFKFLTLSFSLIEIFFVHSEIHGDVSK